MRNDLAIQVRLAREQRGWDLGRLVEAAYVDLPWDAAAITDLESGRISLTVADLVSLSALLGIAPHLLLYPEADTAVALHVTGSAEEEGSGLEEEVLHTETHMPAGEFAEWIWDPDTHAATHIETTERDLWTNASA